jgi:putative endonuclease
MSYWVYMLASKLFGTLYVGVTNDVVRRAYEHREGLVDGFTKQHRVKMLVYYEEHATALEAIQREKNIKHWPRAWKVDLVRKMNPEWRDLFGDIAQR